MEGLNPNLSGTVVSVDHFENDGLILMIDDDYSITIAGMQLEWLRWRG